MVEAIMYVDSSVVLDALFPTARSHNLRLWFDEQTRLVSSRLMRTEVIRALRREQIPNLIAAPVFRRVGLIGITNEIHVRAEAIHRHIKTLDALHLATVQLLGAQTVLATYDKNMFAVANVLGMQTVQPVSDVR